MNEQDSLPVIGISTYRDEASWGVWRNVADIQFAQYADAVVEFDGVPVLLTPAPVRGPHLAAAAAQVLARLDGLIIAGGADIDPQLYDAAPHPKTLGLRPDRDAWELALLDAADARGVPTLGICRGMQLMAVHVGGTLEQHTPDVVGHTGHSPGGEVFGSTTITLDASSGLRAFEDDTVAGPCHHHQSVATHPGFRVTARAADGTIEAMEHIATEGDSRFRIGVQWHPEMGSDHAPIRAVIQAAREFAAASG